MKTKSNHVELVSRFYRKNHCAFFLSLVSSILGASVSLIVSWIIKIAVDILSGVETTITATQLLIICGIFVAFIFGVYLLNYISEPRFIRRSLRQYKDYAFSMLTGKNISAFRDEDTATYLSALTNDTATIEANYLSQIFPIITKAVTFFGALILMLITSPVLTGVVLLVLTLPTLASVLTGKKMKKAQQVVSNKNADFTSMLSDVLGGFQEVKSFKAEKEAITIFTDQNRELEDSKFTLRRIGVIIAMFGTVAGLSAQLLVFVAGLILSDYGFSITAGTVLMFVNLMNFLIMPISELPRLLAGKKASSGLIDKLAESLGKNNNTDGSQTVQALEKGITLSDVSFSYDGKQDVLHNIDHTFLPGKSYAIVGGSGSGKSTFLNLLMAGNNNYKGEIFFDEKELKTISSDSLYDLMTVIRQNVFIFNSDIRNNVTMFRSFPEEKVRTALSKAHLDELIRERGENYLCGESGKGLSGGEKQRISIARSLLKDASILLADEVTSALDAQTSHEVINEILDLEDITRIVVTHSLEESILRRYDEILVIKDGTIEEKGNFDTLMANDGYFKALYTVTK